MKLTLEQAEQMMKKSNGNLDLWGRRDITELPDNLTVGGCLNLSNSAITSLPDNLTVGSLYLSGSKITSIPDNLTVGSLYLSGSKITSIPDNLTVGGWLNLSNTKITSLPDNLTVGGGLYLSGTKITSLPDNLTVGGWLDLRDTKITSLPDSLTVGHLYLDSTKITDKDEELRKVKLLKDGDYVPNKYIYVDRMLTPIRAKRHINGYDLYVGKIKEHNVISDGKHYAHCRTFKEGVADLLFKNAKDRGAEQYKNLTLESTVTKDEAITMYRIITGACRQGTERFVNSLGKLKDTYTVKEIIKLTKGQYNSECFEKFFLRGDDYASY